MARNVFVSRTRTYIFSCVLSCLRRPASPASKEQRRSNLSFFHSLSLFRACRSAFFLLRQVVLQMRSNAVAWNPQEPMNFVCANEDTNLYTFDLRNLNQVSGSHEDGDD